MSWRMAENRDDDRVVALSLALYREDPSPRPVPEAHTRATLAQFRAEPARGCTMVLDVAGAIEGYALLASFWSNECGGEICTVDEFYVTPAHRGAGHGRKLLESLKTGNYAAIDLEVTPDNARARKFYESVGLKPAKNAHLRYRP
jgi:ribosomal protein S18 acetylase RimI-like enzyme